MTAPLAVLLAATLRFTLPGFDADTSALADRCQASQTAPCRDLDSVFVFGQQRGHTAALLLYSARVRGREGQEVLVPLALDSVTTVWVVTRDTAGLRSCPSNMVGVNLVAGAPRAPAAPPLEWFDVAGRRLPGKPTAPGVYFWRRGRERGVRAVFR